MQKRQGDYHPLLIQLHQYQHSHPINSRTISDDITSTSKPNYRKEAPERLKELLRTDPIRHEVKQYCLDELSYTELINRISKEESRRKVKRPRQRKGPRMVNRRDNCNTQKVNMYRFTQSSFQQNRRVTIDQILKGTLG